jgi:hypothetical protein
MRSTPNRRRWIIAGVLVAVLAAGGAAWWLSRPAPSPYVASSIRAPFHRRDCRWADRIDSANRVEYQTRDAAIAAGHRPCKVCRP